MSKFCYKCGSKMIKISKNEFDNKTGKQLMMDICCNSQCDRGICPITKSFHSRGFWRSFFSGIDQCKCGQKLYMGGGMCDF